MTERGRAAHARRIGVQDLDVSGEEVGACASGERERVAPGLEGEAPDDAGRLMVGESLPRLRVEKRHGAILVTDRERASVGAERDRSDRIAVALQDADRRGTAQERREEVGAGGDRVVQRGAGAGEEKRPVEPVFGEGLRAEALGVGRQSDVASVAALVERQDARRDRDR
jgi:hypothetical protein